MYIFTTLEIFYVHTPIVHSVGRLNENANGYLIVKKKNILFGRFKNWLLSLIEENIEYIFFFFTNLFC